MKYILFQLEESCKPHFLLIGGEMCPQITTGTSWRKYALALIREGRCRK
jgi:hypothetical protein